MNNDHLLKTIEYLRNCVHWLQENSELNANAQAVAKQAETLADQVLRDADGK